MMISRITRITKHFINFLLQAIFKIAKKHWCHARSITIQSSRAISNSEGTGQKVRDSVIFDITRLGGSEITPGENSR